MNVNELKKRRARTIRFRILSAIAGLVILFALLEMGLRLLPVGTGLRAVEVNESNPVFRFTPNREYIWSKNWNFSIVNKGRVNKNGFVNDFDYDETLESPPLLAVIGDNFIVGAMVPYQDTLHGRLAKRLGDRGRVYSFAAGGAPLSQYLVYAEHAGQTYAPEAMIFVITNNTGNYNLLDDKSKPGFHYFVEDSNGELGLTRIDFKPSLNVRILRKLALVRYAVMNLNLPARIGDLLAVRSPNELQVEEVAANAGDSIEPNQVADMKRAIDAFLDQLPTRSGLPESRHLIVLDGLRPNIYAPGGLAAAEGSRHDLARRHFLQAAQQRGYEIIDMQPLFLTQYQQDGLRFEFPTDDHWNSHGHGAAADAIASSRAYARAFGN